MGCVIKREQLATTSPFSFHDLEKRAEKLIADARAQAAALIAQARLDAREQIAQLQREAAERGQREGYEAGTAEAQREARDAVFAETREQAQRVINVLSSALADFDARKHRLLAAAETGTIELALAIATRVCKLEPPALIEAAKANARCLLEMCGEQGDLDLHVNPRDRDDLAEWVAEFVTHCESLDHVTVVADADVGSGGCVLRGRGVTIDARIETQLERVAAALRGEAGEEGAGGDD